MMRANGILLIFLLAGQESAPGTVANLSRIALRNGTILEVSIVQESEPLVLLRDSSGALYSIRAKQIDWDASRHLSRPRGPARTADASPGKQRRIPLGIAGGRSEGARPASKRNSPNAGVRDLARDRLDLRARLQQIRIQGLTVKRTRTRSGQAEVIYLRSKQSLAEERKVEKELRKVERQLRNARGGR